MFDLSLLNPGLEHQFRPAHAGPSEPSSPARVSSETPQVAEPGTSKPRLTPVRQSLDFAQHQSLELSLKTRDGDQITLSLSALTAHSERQDSGGFERTSLKSNQLQLSINGSLDEQELEDLNQFLGQVEELAHSFYGGDLAGAFELAQEFDISGTELASFNLNLSSQTQMRQVREYRSIEGRPQLADGLMQEMSQYLNRLLESADSANHLASVDDLLTPVLDWLDQGDGLFSRINQNLLDELLPMA